MKKISAFIFCCITLQLSAEAQENNMFPRFIKSFQRRWGTGSYLLYDSCFVTGTLIKVNLDTISKEPFLSVADDAPVWLHNEVKNIASKVDKTELEVYVKDRQQKYLLFPLHIHGRAYGCKHENDLPVEKNWYQFSGKTFSGDLMQKIVIHLLGSSHKR